MRVAAILTAAGAGTRLGSREPKALVPLAGTPLLVHAARRLQEGGAHTIVVTCPTGRTTEFAALTGAVCVEGGRTRQASVAAGLRAIDDADVVLVHDAARALASAALMRRVLDELAEGAVAVIPGLPVVDTIKQVAAGTVAGTVDRSTLVAVQTPQGFAVDVLRTAHDRGADLAGDESGATDDAGLVERFTDQPVRVVPGEEQAMKVTTATDLALAEAMLAAGEWT